ncbi:Gfo/Idh/MocA family oxidoreductase [Rhodoluna sp.]|uniref:Gfo/Idh/MocA family protein n=1 Tax=Rhodoluna sp. TaxID=1969481 RepID=UPI0025D8C660|nr:Gfo/Idh/MocA family oxidoreductase [Rhodoluna sp.]
MTIGVAVIGAGMAGRGHAAAYRAATSLYESNLPEVKLVSIGDVNAQFGEAAAKRFGFERHDSDWRAIADDPNIHAVSVVVANHLHREIVEGLLAAGKNVLCEKPLSDTLDDARAMVAAANNAKGIARIGLTFLRNPAIAAVQQIIASGQLGKVLHFSGDYWCDYSCDPNAPISWRYKGGMGTGALADVGSHLTYIAEFITGKTFKSISGAQFVTSITERPVAAAAVMGHGAAEVTGQMDTVENDDYAGFTADFGGVAGVIQVSRVAAGQPNSLEFEVYCEKGAAKFSMTRPAEFQLMLREDKQGQTGFRTVLVGPDHPYVAGGVAIDAPGIGVGQNDQFFFQNRAFLAEVAGLPETSKLPFCATFEDGLHNMQIIEAAIQSGMANGAASAVPAATPSYIR